MSRRCELGDIASNIPLVYSWWHLIMDSDWFDLLVESVGTMAIKRSVLVALLCEYSRLDVNWSNSVLLCVQIVL